MNLEGLGILVAGGSIGIGKTVAMECAKAGASVAICARTGTTLLTAEREIRQQTGAGQLVFLQPCDLTDASSVEALMEAVASKLPNFYGVVNCAAKLGPIGLLEGNDVSEWIGAVQTNLIGTMLLCRAALPQLRQQGRGRLINFSGGGATSPRPRFSAYAASKAAVVRFTETLAEELSDTEITANCVAPGAVNTRMLQELLDAGPDAVGDTRYREAELQRENGGAGAERAAELCVRLLSSDGDGVTGRLISAIWDPWDSLPSWKQKLAGSDVFTLRRVVPQDRGVDL